jgi:putative hydrolase of the HAD superfamily
MGEPRAVFFDLRGTLIDVSSGWRLTDEERIRFLRSCGVGGSDTDLRRALSGAVAEVNEIARRRQFFDQDRLVLELVAGKLGLTVAPERIDAFEEWRNKLFVRAVEAYPDAAITLLGLRIERVVTGCVADGHSRWVRLALRQAGLLDLLDVIVASEESGEVKATGAALRLACARAGLEPEDVVFVGDRLDKDIAMARTAGARAVLLDRDTTSPPSATSIWSLAEIANWQFETRGETVRWSTSTTLS